MGHVPDSWVRLLGEPLHLSLSKTPTQAICRVRGEIWTTESLDSDLKPSGETVGFNVVANDTTAVEVACTGSSSVTVLSGPKSAVEQAGRPRVPWKELMMLKRAVRERVVEGILVS